MAIVGNMPKLTNITIINTKMTISQIISTLKPAIGRPCVLALGDSGTVPAITCDCSRVAELFNAATFFRPVCVYVFEINAYVRK